MSRLISCKGKAASRRENSEAPDRAVYMTEALLEIDSNYDILR